MFAFQEYKPPASQDIPEYLQTLFYNSGNNPGGVLGAKATGEPSAIMGVAVLLAIKRALAAARVETLGSAPDEWFDLCKFYIGW